MTVKEVYSFIENFAPFKYQDSYDNSGLLIGANNTEVKKICVCLDITLDIIEESVQKGANLIISHHPVIFKALKSITGKNAVSELLKNNINVICAHTNADAAFMSDVMLSTLGMPKAFEIIKVLDENIGHGKIVNLHEFISPGELAFRCKDAFKSASVKYLNGGKFVSRIGVVPGSAGEEIFKLAASKGCHALIAGEVKHSVFVEAKNLGVTLIAAGHFATENIFCEFIKSSLLEVLPDAEVFTADKSVDICDYI